MKKILVIEDDPALQESIIEVLERNQYQTISAANGQEGIELAQSHSVDLVVCDVVMPELDGFEVLAQIRSLPGIKAIPFIFLTARTDKPDIRHGMELGADDYLTKPFTRKDLLSAVKARFEKQATVHQQYQQKLEELRGQLSTHFPHELLTPLNSIVSLSSYLTSYASVLQTDEVSEIASLVCKAAQRIERTIQNSLLYAKLRLDIQNKDFSSYQQETCDCPESAITNAAMSIVERSNRAVDLSLQRSKYPVLIDRSNLEKIVEELVDNACKFSLSNVPIYIISEFRDEQFILEIKDRGQGITPIQIKDIGAYVQFERKFYEQQGIGLGLVIVRQLVEIHNGKLEIDSNAHGTTIRVTLPVYKT